MCVSFTGLRPVKKMGHGSSPHSLSPITGIGRRPHPSSGSPAASFPTLRRSAWTIAGPFRPRSGAGPRCRHQGRSGEASQPGSRAPAGTRSPNPDRSASEMRCIRSTRRKVGIPPLRDRWPCATGLASYPSSCLFVLRRTAIPDFSPGPPARWILLRGRGQRRPFRRLPLSVSRTAQSATIASCFASRLRDRIAMAALILSSRTAGWWIATLAHSSNSVVITNCVHPGA